MPYICVYNGNNAITSNCSAFDTNAYMCTQGAHDRGMYGNW